MKPTENDSVDDGFSFEATTSSVEVTRGERLRNFYEEYIYKPALIAWDDRRTRYGSILFLLYVGMATIGVWLYRAPDLNQASKQNLVEGSGRYVMPFTDMDVPLGTTGSGVDVLAQAIHATPNMLLMVFSGAIFSTVVAVAVGTIAGYKGGFVDRAITTVSDMAMAIPGLPVVMVLAYGLQIANPVLIGIIIMVNYWAGLARALRSEVLKLRESSYVEASRAMGVSTSTILRKDILPGLMPYIMVNFAFAARYVVFASVGLYYLGVLSPTLGNWGLQLDSAYNDSLALQTPGLQYLVIVPIIFIALLALSLVLLAQGLDRLFNPRVRTRLAGESESTVEGEEDEVVASGGV